MAFPAATAQETETSFPGTERTAQTRQSVAPEQLSQALDRVLHGREYAWRFPRTSLVPDIRHDNWIVRTLRDMARWVSNGLEQIRQFIGKIMRKLDSLFTRRHSPGNNWNTAVLEDMVYVLIAIGIALVVFLAIRIWIQNYRERPAVAEAVTAAPVDLEQEDILPDVMPGQEWLNLSEELFQQGKYRLALRALFLASLASLHEQGLLHLERFKSNREYCVELQRHRHALEELVVLFEENVREFDACWYGRRAVMPESVRRFGERVRRICSHA